MMQTRAFTISAQSVGDRRVRFICSTKAVDRHGTRFHPRGCRHANFDKNPVFLWNHNKEGDPDDVIGHVVDLQITDDAVIAIVEFDTGKKAQKCLRRVRRGLLRAVSIGFISLRELPPDSENVIDVLEWELCELSLVPVGSNPEALATRGFTVRASRGVQTSEDFAAKLKTAWSAIYRPQVAAILVERSDGCTLWGRRRDSGKYTAPGGKLNAGENPEQGGARELKEEAGITAPLVRLGRVDTDRVVVHCFRATVPQDTAASGANDPDREVETWEWLREPPSVAELHHPKNALLQFCRSLIGTSLPRNEEIDSARRSLMDPKMILEKLGLAEGATPEAVATAIVKYCMESQDSPEDKAAVVLGVLAMLVPAPSTSSTSDGAKDAAMDAMVDEVRKLQSRVAELEGQKDAAEKRAEPTPEERADKACKSGQWPMGQRGSLVEQFKANKSPYLFPEKTFSTRGVSFTSGGNPVQTEAKTAPNFGSDQNAPRPLNNIDNLVLGIAKRSGIPLTAEKFAAARTAGK